jgi:hypothetical protein
MSNGDPNTSESRSATLVALTASKAIETLATRQREPGQTPSWSLGMDAPPWALEPWDRQRFRMITFSILALVFVAAGLFIAWHLIGLLDSVHPGLQPTSTNGEATVTPPLIPAVQEIIMVGGWISVGVLFLFALGASYRGAQLGLLRISASESAGSGSPPGPAAADASGASSKTLGVGTNNPPSAVGSGRASLASREPVLIAGVIQAAVSVGVSLANLSSGSTAAILALSAAALAAVVRSQVTPTADPQGNDGTPLAPAAPGNPS